MDKKLKSQPTVFDDIRARDIKTVKKYMDEYESSSEEEELDDSAIIDKLCKNYDGETDQLQKTAAFLENLLHSGSATCLICIGSIKRTDKIWSCNYCYCIFHLLCVKRWGNDSVALLKNKGTEEQGYYNNVGEYIPKKIKVIKWSCPQCRTDYAPERIPSLYMCFCGKEENPTVQDWLLPHSCGEPCEKSLQPDCGHKCRLLCHPGPCPPCAQNVHSSCLCGKSNPKVMRCFQKIWTCEKKCVERLTCGKHVCNQICHQPGQCPPCKQRSLRSCVCGSVKLMVDCFREAWHCETVCNKEYSCGHHRCEKICHDGACGDCPLSLPRTCPCGKTMKMAPCNEPIETCDETCQKLLLCGKHYCNQRCHKGECSLCLIVTKKTCRCRMHERELPCCKDFLCESKCKKTRDCGKHACNKKCCDGQCPPCDKICGKTLSCKKHRCSSICHDGPCYPCKLKSVIKCSCGQTTKTIPCGRERKVRIFCKQICRVAPKCHHKNEHKCHRGECPPCTQICGLENDVTKCEHPCEARCHSAVRVPIKQIAGVQILSFKNFELKSFPHPKCEKSVFVACLGGHETSALPCWNSKPTSCLRLCERLLKCGNHHCERQCHSVLDPKDQNEQEGCEPCVKGCILERPQGCVHKCKKPCHPPPCEPCALIIKTPCHCGLNIVFFKCSEYNSFPDTPEDIAERREKLKCCGNRCIKTYPCGHRCTAVCHSGPCPNPEACRKKVKMYCECKHRKVDVSCDKIRCQTVTISCDENCTKTLAELEKMKQIQNEKQRIAEAEQNRLELEKFERKFNKRKPKERNVDVPRLNDTHNWKKITALLISGLAISVAIMSFYFYQ